MTGTPDIADLNTCYLPGVMLFDMFRKWGIEWGRRVLLTCHPYDTLHRALTLTSWGWTRASPSLLGDLGPSSLNSIYAHTYVIRPELQVVCPNSTLLRH